MFWTGRNFIPSPAESQDRISLWQWTDRSYDYLWSVCRWRCTKHDLLRAWAWRWIETGWISGWCAGIFCYLRLCDTLYERLPERNYSYGNWLTLITNEIRELLYQKLYGSSLIFTIFLNFSTTMLSFLSAQSNSQTRKWYSYFEINMITYWLPDIRWFVHYPHIPLLCSSRWSRIKL